MKILLVLLLIVIMTAVSVYIFRHGKRMSECSDEELRNAGGCSGCGMAHMCNDVKRFEKLAEERAGRK